jgi:hypothetical protein
MGITRENAKAAILAVQPDDMGALLGFIHNDLPEADIGCVELSAGEKGIVGYVS